MRPVEEWSARSRPRARTTVGSLCTTQATSDVADIQQIVAPFKDIQSQEFDLFDRLGVICYFVLIYASNNNLCCFDIPQRELEPFLLSCGGSSTNDDQRRREETLSKFI